MTPATRPRHDVRPLFDLRQLAELIDAVLPPQWSDRPSDVRIDRCWPTHQGGFRFEWSFALGAQQRYTLFGQNAPEQSNEASASPEQEAPCHDPRITSGGLRGVRHNITEMNLLIHSPDCDPDMPQLAECLDRARIFPVLDGIQGVRDRNGSPSPLSTECWLLGYKPGRRAALAYEIAHAPGDADRILGKTFRDHRGEQLGRLHHQLNDAFRSQNGSCVRVSRPLIYVSDLRLMLFEWAPELADSGWNDSAWAAVQSAVEVLKVLHAVELRNLRLFSQFDELAVVQRWHQVLCVIDPQAADELAPSLEILRRASESMDPAKPCTIHRDFYESQYVNTLAGITLLDLDTLCRGHRCLDLGNFLSHLYLRLLREGHPPERFGELAAATIDKYQESSQAVNPQVLEFYLASSLFRLGAVHALRTETRQFAKPMWQLMRDRLDSI